MPPPDDPNPDAACDFAALDEDDLWSQDSLRRDGFLNSRPDDVRPSTLPRPACRSNRSPSASAAATAPSPGSANAIPTFDASWPRLRLPPRPTRSSGSAGTPPPTGGPPPGCWSGTPARGVRPTAARAPAQHRDRRHLRRLIEVALELTPEFADRERLYSRLRDVAEQLQNEHLAGDGLRSLAGRQRTHCAPISPPRSESRSSAPAALVARQPQSQGRTSRGQVGQPALSAAPSAAAQISTAQS